jgi:hypothetical protein
VIYPPYLYKTHINRSCLSRIKLPIPRSKFSTQTKDQIPKVLFKMEKQGERGDKIHKAGYSPSQVIYDIKNYRPNLPYNF